MHESRLCVSPIERKLGLGVPTVPLLIWKPSLRNRFCRF
ncbi:hypothetical protein THF5H11_40473 [Vibrio jasicida]|uniref:Uncharacterized protein n=1 Tax=Vibrio jasicida TaxID=766224 RepID=A0AAU9QSG6_9VIBR|nr:hypothetical protein THF5H11_40473 [Vibrio jasicida]CAH1597587.1 hypothetical protein THF1C08_440031 [Vibrio jasicida]CAH1600899.1 hypothetical protein THF1A12_440030 [Vibrio jasicida]